MSVKRSGRKSVCAWGWMSAEGAGFLHRVNGKLTSQQYIRILENSLVPYAWARFGPTDDNPIPFVQDRSPIHKAYMWYRIGLKMRPMSLK
jgi:hypothetical protein